ncbi:MAG: RepB family plasmid replication initiator protein [Saprospiraceae bacterium]|nr:RepB family plasmid replication initiator protein [Saprospiraceae bacterium]
MAKAQKKINKGVILIKKSNNLVESKYKFDIWETRFFLSVLSQIRRDDMDFQVYRIWYKDIIKVFGLKSGDSYAYLREAARQLMSKSVQINYEENGIKRTKELHLINKIDYLTEGQNDVKNIGNHEYVDVSVEQEMRPFLLQLSKNFTAYDLRNVTKLSMYSIRLYELLKQYEAIGVRTLGIEEMKNMFQVEDQYKLYSDFYRWIIKPSEIEINKHTDILILDIEKLKEGRKIVSLRFKFRAKTEQELSKIRGNPFQSTLLKNLREPEKIDLSKEIEENVSDIEENEKKVNLKSAEIIEKSVSDIDTTAQEELIVELSPIVVMKFGVGFKMFMSLVEKYTEGEIRMAIQVTEKAVQSGKITNIGGFFVEALRGHYQDAEEQKKKIILDKMQQKKGREEELKKFEQESIQKKTQENRLTFERQKAIFEKLIEEDDTFWLELEETIKADNMIKNHYDFTIDVYENMQKPMIAGVLMSIAEKLRTSVFK